MKTTKLPLLAGCLLLLILGTGAFPLKRKFPEFSYQDQFGKQITEQDLLGKKTLLVHFHLGCPASAGAIADFNFLYEELDHEEYQLIGILENSPKQLQDFFSTDTTIWSGLKAMIAPQEPPKFSLLAECDSGRYIRDEQGEITGIDVACRKISRKLGSKSCPLIYWIDEEGRIRQRENGYYVIVPKETFAERKAELMAGFDW